MPVLRYFSTSPHDNIIIIKRIKLHLCAFIVLEKRTFILKRQIKSEKLDMKILFFYNCYILVKSL